MNQNRLLLIRNLQQSERLSAIIIFGLTNIRYLSGFTGTDGVLLFIGDETVFLTDSRYITQAQTQVTADRIICYKNKLQAIADELVSFGDVRVGFDAEAVCVAVFDELRGLCGKQIHWLPLKEQLRPLRGKKDSRELACLRAAAQINHDAFQKILPLIRPGVSEKQLALELEISLKRLGGEANAFDFIVASGKRGALPHGVASDKFLTAGELITIDFGTCVDGYYSDETVTLAVGEVSGKLRQIFDIVLEAHDLALAAIQPGLQMKELDAVARGYIAKMGYGDYFGHGLGHGVGLEIHEYPTVSSRSADLLAEGMVITIEPGIYIPELGGVRIEDTVVVTANGYQSLTSIAKHYSVLNAE
ncbi:aminopeptidase P family protein [Pelobacter seleniigenes]|uniref:aminopeptidase P family protein n=1 Tax=Pelobacter seleniigenes TaxID=407188 RepID=UPI0004A73F0A|nr:aminopeptidase P family protein [Pelobacter seleniigenes]